jgi:hypothetical protein
MAGIDNTPMQVILDVGGTINGQRLKGDGTSAGIIGGGIISADLSCAAVPDGFPLGVLAYVLMTGQPSLGYVCEGAANPFVTTGGVYQANRTVDFGEHGKLATEYAVSSAGPGMLRAEFDIKGEFDNPVLARVLPTVETWVPRGPGVVQGHFTMVWETDDGDYVKGEIETTYRLPAGASLREAQYRYIAIEISPSRDALQQREQIVVIPEARLAEALSQLQPLVGAGA